MKVDVERLDKNKLALEVEVDKERVDTALHKAYRKIAKQVSIPGFRKGKAPRQVIELRFGIEPIHEEALDMILPEAWAEAIVESDIEPIDRPEVEILQFEDGQPLRFKATVEVKPEVELGEFKGLSFEKEIFTIGDEDVKRELEALQERMTSLEPLEEEGAVAEEGHTVLVDFEGFIDGEPFEGGKAEGYSLELGGATMIPGFEEGIIGAAPGEEREISVTFPEDYGEEEFAGKDAIFKLTVKEIKRKSVPELDDDFAKSLGEYESLQELEEDIEKNLREAAENRTDRAFRNKVIDGAVDNASVEIPEPMIKQWLERAWVDLEKRMQNQGLTTEQYLQFTGQTREEIEEQFRQEADKDIKRELVLEAIAKAEGIEVQDEDLDREYERLAEAYGQPADTLRKLFETQGRVDTIKDSLVVTKTVDSLIEWSKVTEVNATLGKEGNGQEQGEEEKEEE